jgi:hypothetical protein
MTDVSHPQYSNYQQATRGNSKAWDAWCNDLYGKAASTAPVPKDAVIIDEEGVHEPPVTRGEPAATSDSHQEPLIDETTLTPEARMELAKTRDMLGAEFPRIVNEAKGSLTYVYEEPTAMDMLEAWDPIIDKLGDYKDAFTFEVMSVVNKWMTRATNEGGGS